MTLPADSHVHSEWSWDAPMGSMERSCAQAVDLGLPAIAFTEHLDHTVWTVALDALDASDHLAALATPDGLLTPPEFDASGYLEAIERCRERFPSLRILSGLEMGEPHWHAEAARRCSARAGSIGCSAPCTASQTGTGSQSRGPLPAPRGSGGRSAVLGRSRQAGQDKRRVLRAGPHRLPGPFLAGDRPVRSTRRLRR